MVSRRLTFHDSVGCQVRGSFETDLAEVCAPRQMNVGLLAYSPLAGGSLSGKYIKGNDPKARFNLFPGGCRSHNFLNLRCTVRIALWLCYCKVYSIEEHFKPSVELVSK